MIAQTSGIRKGYLVKAEDIKHEGRLSTEDIQDIDHKLVFEWVKTGQWKRHDFEKWLKAIRVIE
jgi:hypothetical protein